MSIAEFLDGLPSYDERNFSRYHSSHGLPQRAPVYLSTADQPFDQVIVTDKSNLLLRYLHRSWNKKPVMKKRESDVTTEETGSTSTKRRKVD